MIPPGCSTGGFRFALRALLLFVIPVSGFLSGSARAGETIRIGWENDPPKALPGPSGAPTGLAVDLVQEAARRRGIALQWIRRDESAEAALRSGAVDLWPMMRITPERKKFIHFSEPYFDSYPSLMVRRDSAVHRFEDLSTQAVGYKDMPVTRTLMREYLPHAKPVPIREVRDLLESLCGREIEAALIERDQAIQEVLKGAGCPDPGLAILVIPGARIHFGVAANPRAAAAADAIRAEIDSMAAEGVMTELYARWGYLTGRSEADITALVEARRHQWWAEAAAAVFAFLFLAALAQTVRMYRESRRARRAETALRGRMEESRLMQERLRLLAHALRGAGESIYIEDPEGRIVFVNDAFLRLYEYPESEIIGRPAESLYSGPVTEDPHSEIRSRSRSGREFLVSHSRSRVYDEDGRFVALVTVASDITERKQAEEERRALEAGLLQARKMESLGQLAGGVAHDFNNLLTVILGYSRLLEPALSGNAMAFRSLNQITAAADRASELTRQLLTFSRRNPGNPGTVRLAAIVTGFEPMLRRIIEENVAIIVTDQTGTEAGDQGLIFADASLVEQVILNLAVNARDAMPEGGRLLIETSRLCIEDESAALAQSIATGTYICLSVTDEGEGMTAEVQSRIFEPFFTTKEPGKGTGLGLATVYGIVKQTGASIRVDSTPGVGTSVRVFFPATSGIVQNVSTAPEKKVAHIRGEETVLVVEDETGVRNYVRAVLESAGYTVLSAADGAEALETAVKWGVGRIELLLTDMVLPGINGIEVIRRLRALHPAIPVLRMSGYPERFGNRLLDDSPCIRKPFGPEILLDQVRAALDAFSPSAQPASNTIRTAE